MAKKVNSKAKKRDKIIDAFHNEVYQNKTGTWHCVACDIDFNSGNLAHVQRHLNTHIHKTKVEFKSLRKGKEEILSKLEEFNERAEFRYQK